MTEQYEPLADHVVTLAILDAADQLHMVSMQLNGLQKSVAEENAEFLARSNGYLQEGERVVQVACLTIDPTQLEVRDSHERKSPHTNTTRDGKRKLDVN
jgi:hypothetical protein